MNKHNNKVMVCYSQYKYKIHCTIFSGRLWDMKHCIESCVLTHTIPNLANITLLHKLDLPHAQPTIHPWTRHVSCGIQDILIIHFRATLGSSISSVSLRDTQASIMDKVIYLDCSTRYCGVPTHLHNFCEIFTIIWIFTFFRFVVSFFIIINIF